MTMMRSWKLVILTFCFTLLISLCDCSTDSGLQTADSEESRLVGKIVYRSYIILEQSMASFSIYTNANSSNFANFFSKFDDVSTTSSTELGQKSGRSSFSNSITRKGRRKGQRQFSSNSISGSISGPRSSYEELPQSATFHLQQLVNLTFYHLLFEHYHPDTPVEYSVQFQMLFQFAILLFNCKNYDENIFAKRFLATDFAVKSLQEMASLPADLLSVDALNTVAFQLFLVIHHWDSTEVFDNVVSWNMKCAFYF